MKWIFWLVVILGFLNVSAIAYDWTAGYAASWWVWTTAIAFYPYAVLTMWRDVR